MRRILTSPGASQVPLHGGAVVAVARTQRRGHASRRSRAAQVRTIGTAAEAQTRPYSGHATPISSAADMNGSTATPAPYVIKGKNYVPTSHLLRGVTRGTSAPVIVEVERLHPKDAAAQRDVLALHASQNGLSHVHLLDSEGSALRDYAADIESPISVSHVEKQQGNALAEQQMLEAANLIAEQIREQLAQSTEQQVVLHDERTEILAKTVADVFRAELDVRDKMSDARYLGIEDRLAAVAQALDESVKDALQFARSEDGTNMSRVLGKLQIQLANDVRKQIQDMGEDLKKRITSVSAKSAAANSPNSAGIEAAVVEAVQVATDNQLKQFSEMLDSMKTEMSELVMNASTQAAAAAAASSSSSVDGSGSAAGLPLPVRALTQAMENVLNGQLDSMRTAISQDLKKTLSKLTSNAESLSDAVVDKVIASLEDWKVSGSSSQEVQTATGSGDGEETEGVVQHRRLHVDGKVLAALRENNEATATSFESLQESIRSLGESMKRMSTVGVLVEEGTDVNYSKLISSQLAQINTALQSVDARMQTAASATALQEATEKFQEAVQYAAAQQNATLSEENDERFVRLAQVISESVQDSLADKMKEHASALSGSSNSTSNNSNANAATADSAAQVQQEPFPKDLFEMILQKTLSSELEPVLQRIEDLGRRTQSASTSAPESTSGAFNAASLAEMGELLDDKLFTVTQVLSESFADLLATHGGPVARPADSDTSASQETEAATAASEFGRRQDELFTALDELKEKVVKAVRDEMGEVHQVDFTPVSEYITEMANALIARADEQNKQITQKLQDTSKELTDTIVGRLESMGSLSSKADPENDAKLTETLRAAVESALKSNTAQQDLKEGLQQSLNEHAKEMLAALQELREHAKESAHKDSAEASRKSDSSVDAALLQKIEASLDGIAAKATAAETASAQMAAALDRVHAELSSKPKAEAGAKPASGTASVSAEIDLKIITPLLTVLKGSSTAAERNNTAVRGAVANVQASLQDVSDRTKAIEVHVSTTILDRLKAIEELIRSREAPQESTPSESSEQLNAVQTVLSAVQTKIDALESTLSTRHESDATRSNAIAADLGKLADDLRAHLANTQVVAPTPSNQATNEQLTAPMVSSLEAKIDRLLSALPASIEPTPSTSISADAPLAEKLEVLATRVKEQNTQWHDIQTGLENVSKAVEALRSASVTRTTDAAPDSASSSSSPSSEERVTVERVEKLLADIPGIVSASVKESANVDDAKLEKALQSFSTRTEEVVSRILGESINRREGSGASEVKSAAVEEAAQKIAQLVKTQVQASLVSHDTSGTRTAPQLGLDEVKELLKNFSAEARSAQDAKLDEVHVDLSKKIESVMQRSDATDESIRRAITAAQLQGKESLDAVIGTSLIPSIEAAARASESRQQQILADTVATQTAELKDALRAANTHTDEKAAQQQQKIEEQAKRTTVAMVEALHHTSTTLKKDFAGLVKAANKESTEATQQLMTATVSDVRKEVVGRMDELSGVYQREMEKLIKGHIGPLHDDMVKYLLSKTPTPTQLESLTSSEVSSIIQREQKPLLEAIQRFASLTEPQSSATSTGSTSASVSAINVEELSNRLAAALQESIATQSSVNSITSTSAGSAVIHKHSPEWVWWSLLTCALVFAVVAAVLFAAYLIFAAFLIAFVEAPAENTQEALRLRQLLEQQQKEEEAEAAARKAEALEAVSKQAGEKSKVPVAPPRRIVDRVL